MTSDPAAGTAGGTAHVLVGLGVQAVTTYVFLILAGRWLGAQEFGEVSGLYILLTSIATGLFLPLEQELARRRGAQRADADWEGRLLQRALVMGSALTLAAVALTMLALPVTSAILGGNGHLVAALWVGLLGYACCFAIRGELSGRGELRRYGYLLGIEGAARLVGILPALAVDRVTPSLCGWLFAIAPWLAAGLTLVGRRPHPRRGGAAAELPLMSPVLVLVPGALAAQLLVNAGPLVVSLLATPAERAQAGVLLAALVLIRVPVFLFTAVQPRFLPAVSLHAATDRPDLFARLLRRLLVGTLAFTALSAAVVTVLGPPAVSVLFAFDEPLSRSVYLLLALAAGVFLLATVLAQSLIGLGHHGAATGGWIAGIVGLALGTALAESLVVRASLAFLVGAVTATLVLSLTLRSRLTTSASVVGMTGRKPPARRP